MKNILYLAFIFITLAAFFEGCQNKSESAEEKAIRTMLETFKQMPRNATGNQADFYKPERTVIIKDKNIQLQLRKMNDTLPDPQSLIIIKNTEGVCRAIPLLPNIYYDYWNFEFDKPIAGVDKVNTTFEKEFNMAIDELNLNNELGLSGFIFEELIKSLLHCRQVQEGDSTRLLTEIESYNVPSSLPGEGLENYEIRRKKNVREIMRSIKLGEYYFVYNAYWDQKNNRIYQLVNMLNIRDSIHYHIKLKNYRLDHFSHLLIM
jgi:hypothetical protein